VQVTDNDALPSVVRALDDKGIELAEFALRKASLDEVFLSLTGDSPSPDSSAKDGDNR
jgi:oleandomycin transport system ATP-binding protein